MVGWRLHRIVGDFRLNVWSNSVHEPHDWRGDRIDSDDRPVRFCEDKADLYVSGS